MSNQQLQQYHELMKVIDGLSAQVAMKSKELDQYKKEYQLKIANFDQFVSRWKGDDNIEWDKDWSQTGISELSLHRDANTWIDPNGAKFVVLPLKCNNDVPPLVPSDEEQSHDSSGSHDLSISHHDTITKRKRKHKKQICSLCHTQGHNRAACPSRAPHLQPQV